MSNPTPHRFTDLLGGMLGPRRPRAHLRGVLRAASTATSRSSSPGADADAAVPGMQAHLDGCPACAEDHDSLRALVERQA